MLSCACPQPAVAGPLCDFSCRVLTPLLLLSLLTIASVVYHVDHATSSIYMERVEGHSLKTLLHGGDLGGTGERQQQGHWVNPSRVAGADGTGVGVTAIMSFKAIDLLVCRLHAACASLGHLCCIQAHLCRTRACWLQSWRSCWCLWGAPLPSCTTAGWCTAT